MNKGNWKLRVGIFLMIVSVPLFLVLPVMPFLDLDGKTKITLSTIFLISGEVLFWAGGLLVGKELFTKYRSYFNPKTWFRGKSVKD